MEWDATTVPTLLLVVVAALLYRYLPRWQARSPFIPAEELKRRLDSGEDVVVVDVRTAAEFMGRTGYLPGAVNIPWSELRPRLNAGDPALDGFRERSIVVYCDGELRAARAARLLRDGRAVRVSVLRGGLRRWCKRGYPIEAAP